MPRDIAAYAAFLVSLHESFAAATGTRVSDPNHGTKGLLRRLKGRAPDAKPWSQILDAALAAARPEGLILEFGVFEGRSIRHMAAKRPGSKFHGFDSFEGFPADGRHDWQVDFRVAALPEVPPNVTLHQGYFEETLPAFTRSFTAPPSLALVHIDCDIYSSTATVFREIGPWLQPADILVFDELLNYAECAENELLAFFDFLEERELDFEWVATVGKAYPFLASEGSLPGMGFNEYRRAGYYQNQAVRLIKRDQEGHFGLQSAPQGLTARLAAKLESAEKGARKD